jgi:hypothetical protein
VRAVPEPELQDEARVFGRYLVRGTVPAELVERYCAANAALFGGAPPAADAAIVRFARRHPWSVGFLDGACALLRPTGLLRGKLLVMSAILETSPEFADEFLPRSLNPLGLVTRLAVSGTAAVIRAAVGAVVYAVAARSRA